MTLNNRSSNKKLPDFFQAFPSYDPAILRVYQLSEPAGMVVEEKRAQVPLLSVFIHTFSRILQNPVWDLISQVERLRDLNGGELIIECYSGVGLDGSSVETI